MSIINDALKKAQEKLQKKMQDSQNDMTTEHQPPVQNVPEQAPKNFSQEPVQEKANSIATTLLIVLNTCLLVFILSLMAQRFDWFKPTAVEKKVVEAPQVPVVVEPIPEVQEPVVAAEPQEPIPPPAPDSNALVINGTMDTGEKWIVLINNKIYEVGDTVEGKRILNITLEGVEVQEEQDGQVSFIGVD